MSIPLLGWGLILLGIPIVKVLALGLPALLIAVWIMASLWKEGGRALRERDAAAAMLRYVVDILLEHPRYLDPPKIDRELLFGMAPPPDHGTDEPDLFPVS